MFIGQAMPKVKNHPHHWPSLNSWLYTIGLTDKDIEKNFYYSALVDYFPGYKGHSHKVPTEKEILNERDRLRKTISDFKPDTIVPIGKLSISYCLNLKNTLLRDVIGKTYKTKAYDLTDHDVIVIPLPHPSGASTWRHSPENKLLLLKALSLLKTDLNT